MTSARKRQLLVLTLLVAAGGALALVSLGGIEENLVYYWSPDDIAARGDAARNTTVRLGGVVLEDSLDWNAESLTLRFKVGMSADGAGHTVAVVSSAAPPQMFREGIGVVVEGRYDGAVFNAERLMVKHSNEYHPPKEGEAPHEVYSTIQPEPEAKAN